MSKTSQPTDASTSQPERLRLIYCWPHLAAGGVQQYFLTLASEARRRLGNDVCIQVVLPFGTNYELIESFERLSCKVTQIKLAIDLSPRSNLWGALRRRALDLRAHWALFRALWPLTDRAVIHADIAPWNGSFLIWALLRRAPVFSVFNSPLHTNGRFRTLALTTRIRILGSSKSWSVFASTAEAQVFLEKLLGRSVQLARIGVLRTEIDGVKALAVKQSPNGCQRIVGAGQLIRRKGIDLALDAVSILQQKGYNVQLLWIGSGPLRNELTLRVAELGLEDSIIFLENLSDRKQYLTLISTAQIYIQPSRFEGLPIAMLEAMALGLGVVAADVGGISEVVRNDLTGILVPSDDSQLLGSAIERLLNDPNLVKRLGESASDTVLADFEMETEVKRMIDRYTKALEDYKNLKAEQPRTAQLF
jgi:glycosyltransferase involved in cell wall biosynthesis